MTEKYADRNEQIRRLYAEGGWTHEALGALFDLSAPRVGKIIRYKPPRDRTMTPAQITAMASRHARYYHQHRDEIKAKRKADYMARRAELLARVKAYQERKRAEKKGELNYAAEI